MAKTERKISGLFDGVNILNVGNMFWSATDGGDNEYIM